MGLTFPTELADINESNFSREFTSILLIFEIHNRFSYCCISVSYIAICMQISYCFNLLFNPTFLVQ